MSLLTDLQAQLALIQAKINILQASPSDTFPLGRIALFASNSGNTRWYYVKVAEESWKDLNNPGITKPLNEWILQARESGVGYFEVYEMRPQASPFYASA